MGIRGGARANPPRLESRSNRPWMVEPILKFRGVAAGWKSVSPSPEGGWKTRGGIDHRPSVAEQINQAIRYTCHLHVSSADAPLRKTLETDSPTRSEKRVLYDTGRRKRRSNGIQIRWERGKKKKNRSITSARSFAPSFAPPSLLLAYMIYIYVFPLWETRYIDRKLNESVRGVASIPLRFATLRVEEESLAESRSGKKGGAR